VNSASGSNLTLEYNAAGDLLKKSEGNETTEYAYNPQGDLTLVKQGDDATVYAHNADGQIETINSSRGTTRLTYFPDGKVKSIQFADGSLHEYEHNALGFRESTHRSDGTRMYYGYDASGNLVHSAGSSADGRVAGQVLDVDENARVIGIHYANGDDTAITYDADGNPETLDNGGESPFEYIYDGTNRLVAVRQGDRIAGSHVYTPTEPDLRLQLDNRTMRVGANALRQSTSIGDVLSLLYARPYGSTAGVVRFDQLTRSFDLPSEFGIVLPDAVAANSLVRRKLVDVDDGDVRRRVDFDRPSNVMFVPPEYATINCGIGCTFNGITLRANGSTGPISVVAGNAVSLLASKNSGSGCQLLLCSFFDNGSPIPSNGLNSTSYAFSTPGTHTVAAGCECSPCDVFGDDIVTVQVAAAPACAVPTNFRQTGVWDRGGGKLEFEYQWSSSTGNLNDLSACFVGEHVQYPGTANPYPRPSPPFPAGGHANPTEFQVEGNDGIIGDEQLVPGFGLFVTPYSASSYTAVQHWRYSCPCKNGGAWVNVMGPLNIVRSISQNPNGSWKYTVTKPTGGQASINPLP